MSSTINNISSDEAFLILKSDSNSALIDVRTVEEFAAVGVADLDNINPNQLLLSWRFYPEMKLNPDFASELDAELKRRFKESAKNAKLVFMCKSGGRSLEAAEQMRDLGYKHSYNLAGGFEGSKTTKGWKALYPIKFL